jgi:predicted DCC family thiol-disulfide oxidoreductase YuxK
MRSGPVLLFDGDCAFCSSSARLLERWVRPDAVIVAWQHADLDDLGVSARQANDAVQWVGPDGAVRSGHEAIAATLLASGQVMWRLAGRLLVLPGISLLAAAAYELVAANRHRLPGGTPACQRRWP